MRRLSLRPHLTVPVVAFLVACGAQDWSFNRETDAAPAPDAGDVGPPVEAGDDAPVTVAPDDAEAGLDQDDGAAEDDRAAQDDGADDVLVPCPDGGGCPRAAPVCRPLDHVCVPCTVDNDCAATPARPVCNVTTGACVQCNRSSDCAASSTGSTLPHCDITTSTCVACLITADCPRESFCLSSHTCTKMF